MNGRYVLCRPRGGLNDTLCRIDACWGYARASGRELWVDGNMSGMLDCLSRYFVPPPGMTLAPTPEWMDGLACVPVALSGRVTRYAAEYDPQLRNFIDPASGVQVTFDARAAHAEPLLVYEQCGGGGRGIGALAQMALQPGIAREVRAKVESLGEYTAIHVRNTDYQTDYIGWFREIADKVGDRIVLCTDDRGCQQFAQTIWGERLVLPSELPDTGGKRLHYNRDLDRYATNVGTLTDLFVLAGARQLLFRKTNQGVVSGFSLLAQALHADKTTARRLIGA